jgi:hypothetical protein
LSEQVRRGLNVTTLAGADAGIGERATLLTARRRALDLARAIDGRFE